MTTVNICGYTGRYLKQMDFVEAPMVGDFVWYEDYNDSEPKRYRVANRRWHINGKGVDVELEGLT